MTLRPTAEPMLPLDLRQPRKAGRREPDRVYAAVAFLRRSGRPVYRSGEWHKVDGAYASSGQLLALAVSLGWRP